MRVLFVFYFFLLFLFSCEQPETLFLEIPSSESGLDFLNHIEENERENFIDFSYIYNGGGVAVGDINNDGLPDVYFTGNQSGDKLFLNKTGTDGKLKFEDVTSKAGLKMGGWSTGATMADINGDGLLDIYVCKSGNYPSTERANQLYINQGNNTFAESAYAFSLADTSYSTQAAFLDFDHDNDLDVFIITSANDQRNPNELRKITDKDIAISADKLYENLGNNTFKDISKEAGIFHYGMSLGLSVADFNGDGWDDIFVGNDFLANDLLYLNNQDGTFSQESAETMAHHSQFSMGSDAADINDDGRIDLISVDMMPADYQSLKRMVNPANNFYFEQSKTLGFHPQFMRNMLFLNQGNFGKSTANSDIPRFSELGQFYEIEQTDWSWSPLIADFDNDGFKDLFISNGYLRDITDLDFITGNIAFAENNNPADINQYMKENAKKMPSMLKQNTFFRNKEHRSFENVSGQWLPNSQGLSNGAAYADLDNDGDLDLIVNNINQEATLFQNQSQNNYLTLKLEGYGQNKNAVGAKAELFCKGARQILYQNTTRGYQSSSTQMLHFGLGQNEHVDSVNVYFEGRKHTLINPEINQILTVQLKSDSPFEVETKTSDLLFEAFTPSKNFKHQETPFPDFNIEPLLPHKFSQQGPKLTKGDINGDGLEDFFVGGAYHQSGAFFIGRTNGTFEMRALIHDPSEKEEEDLGVALFDADVDGDLDLYLVSGSNEFYDGSPYFQDRLYLNDGKGNFQLSNKLPKIANSGSALAISDFDKDGDPDIFRGGRLIPTEYPKPGISRLLLNENSVFQDAADRICPELREIGMVTDALWADLDNDSWDDLIVVGELMQISIFRNENGKLVNSDFGKDTEGFWNCIRALDLDNDGDLDLVLGNRGENIGQKITLEKPYQVYGGDFDQNSHWDAISSHFWGNSEYPVHSFDDIRRQMPSLRTNYVTYKAFAEVTVNQLLGQEKINNALRRKAVMSKSIFLINDGNFNFSIRQLPEEVQWSTVNDMLVMDVNADGLKDLITVGNDFGVESFTGQYDASYGNVLINKGSGDFQILPPNASGFWVLGEARSVIGLEKNKIVVIARNNQPLQFYKFVK